jgi:hypothetical protein
LRQGRHKLVERLVEFFDSFVLKLLRHIVDVDSKFRQPLQHPSDLGDILFEPGDRFAMVTLATRTYCLYPASCILRS